jgi:PKHD-type hydroxylase
MIDTRKLSLSLLLSEPEEDFVGGEFFIHLSGNPSLHVLKKGQMIVFPSFMLHGVKPVLSGVRKSIVIWVEGPKFK